MNTRAWLKKFSLSIDERGAALITGLLLVLVLTVLSIAAMMSTATELKIAANDRSSKQIFYLAEAGLEDARSRLQTGASGSPIYDSQPTNPSWTAFIGTAEKVAWKGYDSGNTSQARYDRLNSSLDYVATITHKVDPPGCSPSSPPCNILKWGDSNGDGWPDENTSVGQNIFVISSEGYSSDGALKPLRIEATQVPPFDAPAALYTKAHTDILGTSTSVWGIDQCGTRMFPGLLPR